jgi:hypothetical protein
MIVKNGPDQPAPIPKSRAIDHSETVFPNHHKEGFFSARKLK